MALKVAPLGRAAAVDRRFARLIRMRDAEQLEKQKPCIQPQESL
jgi:hypothetical protein